MSSEQKIALSVVEEPRITQFKSDGEEVNQIELNEEEQFLRVWKAADMRKENLNKEKEAEAFNVMAVRQNIYKNLRNAKEHFSLAAHLLDSIDRMKPQGTSYFKIDPVAKSRDRSGEKTDIKLGALIVNKQLHLQNSSEKLAKSIEELRKTVDESKEYFRQLEAVQRKVHLTRKFLHGNRNITYIAAENPVPFPPTSSASCMLFDKEQRKLKVCFSDNFRININGKYYEPDIGSEFLKENCMLMQNSMFIHFQIETNNELDNYINSFQSSVIEVEDQKISHSSRGERGEVCPMWFPAIVRSSLSPTSMPLKKLRSLLRREKLSSYLYNLIMERFTRTDVCKVFISYNNKHTTFKISSPFTSDTAVAIAYENRIIVSTPTHLKQPTVIDMTNIEHSHKIKHWADVIWFIFLAKSVIAIASSLGLEFIVEKNHVTVNCSDRVVEFEASNEANEAYVAIKKEGQHIQSFLWSFVHGYSLEYKIKLLLLGDF